MRTLSHAALSLYVKTNNVMSEHAKGKREYFVSRTLIPLDHDIEWYCNRLLPNYRRWRWERNTRAYGDKSTCCDTFLNNIIPYFVEVLVQDGIYFVKDFPKHPMSLLLKVSIYSVFLLLSNHFSPCYLYCRARYLDTNAGLRARESGWKRG